MTLTFSCVAVAATINHEVLPCCVFAPCAAALVEVPRRCFANPPCKLPTPTLRPLRLALTMHQNLWRRQQEPSLFATAHPPGLPTSHQSLENREIPNSKMCGTSGEGDLRSKSEPTPHRQKKRSGQNWKPSRTSLAFIS